MPQVASGGLANVLINIWLLAVISARRQIACSSERQQQQQPSAQVVLTVKLESSRRDDIHVAFM